MNIKSPEAIAEIKRLVIAGYGMRPIMKQVGAAKNTVQYYRKEALFDAAFQGKDLLCQCGAKVGHRGFCSYRLERSPKRVEWLKQWTGKMDLVLAHHQAPAVIRARKPKPIIVPKWNRNEVFVRPRHDLEIEIKKFIPSAIPLEIRDDLCQDLIISVLAGELTLAEIPEKIAPFIRKARSFMYDRWKHVSIDGIIPGTERLKWSEVIPSDYAS